MQGLTCTYAPDGHLQQAHTGNNLLNSGQAAGGWASSLHSPTGHMQPLKQEVNMLGDGGGGGGVGIQSQGGSGPVYSYHFQAVPQHTFTLQQHTSTQHAQQQAQHQYHHHQFQPVPQQNQQHHPYTLMQSGDGGGMATLSYHTATGAQDVLMVERMWGEVSAAGGGAADGSAYTDAVGMIGEEDMLLRSFVETELGDQPMGGGTGGGHTCSGTVPSPPPIHMSSCAMAATSHAYPSLSADPSGMAVRLGPAGLPGLSPLLQQRALATAAANATGAPSSSPNSNDSTWCHATTATDPHGAAGGAPAACGDGGQAMLRVMSAPRLYLPHSVGRDAAGGYHGSSPASHMYASAGSAAGHGSVMTTVQMNELRGGDPNAGASALHLVSAPCVMPNAPSTPGQLVETGDGGWAAAAGLPHTPFMSTAAQSHIQQHLSAGGGMAGGGGHSAGHGSQLNGLSAGSAPITALQALSTQHHLLSSSASVIAGLHAQQGSSMSPGSNHAGLGGSHQLAHMYSQPTPMLQMVDVPPPALLTPAGHSSLGNAGHYTLLQGMSGAVMEVTVPPDSPFALGSDQPHTPLQPAPHSSRLQALPGGGSWVVSPGGTGPMLAAAAAANAPFRANSYAGLGGSEGGGMVTDTGSPLGAALSPTCSLGRGSMGKPPLCAPRSASARGLAGPSPLKPASDRPSPRGPGSGGGGSGHEGDGASALARGTWREFEDMYGPALKCSTGSCCTLYDSPCDDHKCACCKMGRRVAAFEKQGFCGACGKREVVRGLRFIRCGMCKAEMVERAYDAHLKQFVIMPDPKTGAKLPIKCKEHVATHPKVLLTVAAGRRCSKCNNMRPLSYYQSEESTCNWHIMQRTGGSGPPSGGR